MTALYVLNVVSAAYASLMALFLLANTGGRWTTPHGALVNGAAVLSLLYLSIIAVLA